MYTHVKEKYIPPSSPIPYSSVRRVVPRHAKGYLWLCFLVLVFGTMILSDNGISLFTIFKSSQSQEPTPVSFSNVSSYAFTSSTQSVRNHALPTSTPVVETRPKQHDESLIFGSGATAFTPDDVVILFKTGATSLWRRVPIHLSTTLSNKTITPNIEFYSDMADHIAGRPIVDVLANVSDTLKSSPDFELYRALQKFPSQNLYLEAAAMDGDHYLPGGWRLDKYKFLPLVAHAAATHPGKKWYIYMEDDNYYFWQSLYSWLGANFDPSKPFFLGSPAARLGEDFAHGGSGFIISGAAMDLTFGTHPDLAHKWENYARERCCGDQVLSHVMALMGVGRDRRYDHTEWMALQAQPTWRMAFGDWNWCSPLFNVHKTHQADVSRLHVLEKQFQAEAGEDAIMTWGHLFRRLILPTLTNARRAEWDNGANEKWFASKEEDEKLSDNEKEKQAWFSADACEKACHEWNACLSWKYADDQCGLASTAAAGRRIDEGIRMDSGFMLDRIERLTRKECKPLGYGS